MRLVRCMKLTFKSFTMLALAFIMLYTGFASANRPAGGSAALSQTLSAEELFTPEEREYISTRPAINAASINGAAPLSFSDEKGQIQGIFMLIMEKISEISGLAFNYSLYDSTADIMKNNPEIIYGITPSYSTGGILLSEPFLETKTILFMNSSVSPDSLGDKIYAAVKGSSSVDGINEENIKYYDNREDALNAVEKGDADYGYGNAFSVAYYSMLNNYKNVVTVPIGKETRKYCIGVLKGDEMLLSIFNKSIATIDQSEIQALILDVASRIDRNVTLDNVLDSYGTQIAAIALFVMSALLVSVISIVRVSNKLREQNTKYLVLSQISNEYIYEYFPRENYLKLSEKFKDIFNTPESMNEAIRILKDALSNRKNLLNSIIRIPMPDGKTKFFKAINSNICGHRGRTDCIIGKLIDVSDEIAEKEKLLVKSQTDGLTGLYNAATTRDLITARVGSRKDTEIDALILMDCDGFKSINDTYGHYVGNQVLEHIATNLKSSFKKTDILGRIGGDEFCVYLKDVPSVSFVQGKCLAISQQIKNAIKEEDVSVSIGISMVYKKEGYEDIFKKADMALYKAKSKGKSHVVIFDEEMNYQ